MSFYEDMVHHDSTDIQHSMKSLLSVAIKEALAYAIVDSIDPEIEENRAKYILNWYSIPDEIWCTIDPGALAQNLICRLMGTGGFMVNGIYAGNASPREIFEASINRPDEDPLGDIKNFLGSNGCQPIDQSDE